MAGSTDPPTSTIPPVVIVHRNQSTSCLRTVDEFRAQSADVHIVVIDNASELPHLDALRSAAHDFTLLELEANLGFGPTANVGLRRWLSSPEPAEWAFIAPHDALVDRCTVQAILDAGAAEPSAGILSADVGDQLRPSVDRFFGALPARALGYSGFEPVDYPHGTLFAIRRQCALDIGLFDERYFAYGEEADLGLRARAVGWQVGLVRDAMVANPTTSGRGELVDYLKHRNTLLMLREHSGRWPMFVRATVLLGEVVVGTIWPKRRPPWFHRRARLRGLADHLRGRYGPPPADL